MAAIFASGLRRRDRRGGTEPSNAGAVLVLLAPGLVSYMATNWYRKPYARSSANLS